MFVDLTQKVIAQWKMNETIGTTIYDSASNHDATLYGASIADHFTTGKIDKALTFGATGTTGAKVSHDADFNVYDCSFSFWMKPTSHIMGYLFDKESQTIVPPIPIPTIFVGFYCLYDDTNGRITFNITDGTNSVTLSSSNATIAYNDWTFVTITVDRDNDVKIFINNQEDVSADMSTITGYTSNSVDFYLGATRQPVSDALSIPFLGILDNFIVYDEALIEGEIDFLWNEGNGTEDLYSSMDVTPTLLYPNGGENFTHKTIQILWEEPLTVTRRLSNKIYWYEIFYSIDSGSEDARHWCQIATIPAGKHIFDWKIPHKIKSDGCRIGIRTVDQEGNKTPIVMSSDVFSVQNNIIPSPGIFAPMDGDRFFTYVTVVFDKEGFAGQFPKRAHYRISYSSSSQEIDWICIGDNIPITTSTYYLDVSSFASSSDYSFKFETIDGENSSQPFFVNDITINNLNFFKIDTVPPAGFISIRNNAEYINNRDIILELTSYDATSGTKSYRIIQKEIDLDADDTISPLYPMSNISSWRIVNADGVKLIQSSFTDYAGNELEDSPGEFFFRTYKNINNREVTSILVDKNDEVYDIWIAFGGVDPELYLNGSSIVGAEVTDTIKFLPSNISGTSLDYEQRYDIEDLGTVEVTFNAKTVKDRLVIEGGGSVLKDTGLISGTTSFDLSVAGLTEIVVKVTSDSDSTGWTYTLDSKNEYTVGSDFYDTFASKDKPAGEILSMFMYGDILYLGVKTKDATGLLQRYVGGSIESVYEISTLDSVINSMVEFDSKLFIACANGELYSFNGTTVQQENDGNAFESGLHKIGTDGNLLYIFLNNSQDIYTAYKNILGELVYTKTTLE